MSKKSIKGNKKLEAAVKVAADLTDLSAVIDDFKIGQSLLLEFTEDLIIQSSTNTEDLIKFLGIWFSFFYHLMDLFFLIRNGRILRVYMHTKYKEQIRFMDRIGKDYFIPYQGGIFEYPSNTINTADQTLSNVYSSYFWINSLEFLNHE
jgi:hypothetical protein